MNPNNDSYASSRGIAGTIAYAAGEAIDGLLSGGDSKGGSGGKKWKAPSGRNKYKN